MGEIGSSVPRRQLGRYLKRAREEAGIALEAAARQLEWSRARMYRIEAGTTSARTLDVEQMCRVYGTSPSMTKALIGLAKESKARGWWHAYGEAIPAWFELFVGMEAAASHIRQYESVLIPGLLQTPEYAAVVFRTKPGVTEDEVARKVALRMERQRLLTRRNPKAPNLDVIIDEAALARPITPEGAWRAQLAKLAVRRPTVSLRVLPSAVGPHPASVAGAFCLMDFPEVSTRPAEPTTIYSENLTGAIYLDKPAEVAEYAEVWRILGELALSAEESRELIEATAKESPE
nr:helix-turn-helix transcriptional regulator [Micromonospora sp. DSM 115978]